MTNMNDLPQDLISNILIRVPVKTLWTLRCVSKEWLRLISDPTFAKLHFETNAAPTLRYLSFEGENIASLCDLDADNGYEALKLSLPVEKNGHYPRIMGSCRGFVLLDKFPNMIVWNPSTGAHKLISYSHIPLRYQVLNGFGYDACNDDYLVIPVWRDDNKEEHFEFFSMRTNSWNSFEVALSNAQTMPAYVMESGIFLKGALHWLILSNRSDSYVLVFDLTKKCFSEIHFPMKGPETMIDLGGSLALLCSGDNRNRTKVWVLKDHKVHSSWTLFATFSKCFYPLGLCNNGDIIGFNRMVIVCTCELFMDCICEQFMIPHGGYITYTESFISLPNDSDEDK